MQQQTMMGGQPKPGMYGGQGGYADASDVYQTVPYGGTTGAQHNMHYTTMTPSVGVVESPYSTTSVFPTPPMHNHTAHSEASPASYSEEQHYGQQDLADLLGSLKMDARGTGKPKQPPRCGGRTTDHAQLHISTSRSLSGI